MFFLKGSLPVLNVYRPISKGVSAQIDSLRGLSALIVLFAHCHQVFISPAYHDLYAITGILAQSAVMVFFVLSGFLIGKSLTHNATSAGGFDISRYATDRANRIIPPVVFATIILLVLFFVAPYMFPTASNNFIEAGAFVARPGLHLDPLSLAGTLLFINGFITQNIPANAPLWSLSFEVWYYIVAAVVFFYRGAKRAIILTVLMGMLGALNNLFLLYSIVWFSGLAICVMHNNSYFNTRACAIACGIFGAPAIVLAAFYISTFSDYTKPSEINMKIINLYSVCFGLCAAAMFSMLINGVIEIRPILRRSSKFSYTLYVTHFPILLFLYGVSQASMIENIAASITYALVAAIICISLASVAARSIENAKPFGALKLAPA